MHVVSAGGFSGDPGGGPQGAAGKSVAGMGGVLDGDRFAEVAEMDGVLADGITDPEGVHANLSRWTLAGHPLASVYDVGFGIPAGGLNDGVL